MNNKKQRKTNLITKALESKNYYVEKYQNGHIKILDINFWCTTEKWHDQKRNKKGLGLPSYIEYLEKIQNDYK